MLVQGAGEAIVLVQHAGKGVELVSAAGEGALHVQGAGGGVVGLQLHTLSTAFLLTVLIYCCSYCKPTTV